MTVRRPHRIRSVPRTVSAGLLAVAVLSGGVAVASTRLRTDPRLPQRSAEQVVAAVIRSAEHPPTVSGTVTARIDLGLPSFPQQGPAPTGLAGFLAELSGDHRLRVWSSPDGYRLDELRPTDERAIFIGADGGWFWSSDTFTAIRLLGPGEVALLSRLGAAREAERSRLLQLVDPLTLAREALMAVSASTAVRVGHSTRVAGRAARVLILTPRDAGTLVGRVEVAVDAGTDIPLSVEVFAKGSGSPSLSASFASISYAAVPAGVYRFEPPPGAIVRQPYDRIAGSPDRGPGVAALRSVRVFGNGWSSILAINVPADQVAKAGSVDGVDLRRLLPFSGPLFSVRLATVGGRTWLLTGAVPQAALASVDPELR